MQTLLIASGYILLVAGYTPLIVLFFKQRRVLIELNKEVSRLNLENNRLNGVVLNLDASYRLSIESELNGARMIARLNERILDMEREMESRTVEMTRTHREFVVVGVWPDTHGQDLNLRAVEDALYNSGIRYIPLTGYVDQRRIMQQLRWNPDVNVLEIDTHGKSLEAKPDGVAGGIQLSDAVLKPGWWIRVMRTYRIPVVVLMACQSEEVGRVMAREGAEHVICCMQDIPDSQAIKFTQAFYECLADGLSVQESVSSASLEMDYREAARIVLINNAQASD